MKLEVPCMRIMRGEAANLSPSASKLLITLLGCQDRESMTVSRSKNTFLRLTGLQKSSFFMAKKELAEKQWITLDGPFIVIQPDGQLVHDDEQIVQSHGHLVHGEKPLVQRGGQIARSDGLKVQPRGHRSDQERDPDQGSAASPEDARLIGHYYNMEQWGIEELWKVCRLHSRDAVLAVFQTMKRTTVNDPLAYMRTSLENNGHSGKERKLLELFADTLE